MTSRLRYGVLAVVAVLMLSTEVSAVEFSFGGHTYELITASRNWETARSEALAAGGYLVNITSGAENQFLVDTFAQTGQFFAWIGASDAAIEGEWRWMDGPEAGDQFWQGGPGGSATGGSFANWDVIEPNNSGDEDAAALNLGATQSGSGILNAKWGDTDIVTSLLPGYIIERDPVAQVPEPSTTIMLLLGLSVAAFRRTRRGR